MASYIELDGVRTWYDERGSGEPLVLLHPGGVDSRVFDPNLGALAGSFRTFTPERRGHGHTPDVDGALSFEAMAQDTIRFIEQVVTAPARLLGCSDGATVALLVALRRSDLVTRLVFVAGVFHHDGWLPQAIDPTNSPPDFLVRSYGEVSPDGIDHFPVVAEKLARMHLNEPTLTTDELGKVTCRTLVMLGDDDEVRLEHALSLYRNLPDADHPAHLSRPARRETATLQHDHARLPLQGTGANPRADPPKMTEPKPPRPTARRASRAGSAATTLQRGSSACGRMRARPVSAPVLRPESLRPSLRRLPA